MTKSWSQPLCHRIVAGRQRTHLFSREGQLPLAGIDDDEIIAQPVHAGKGDGACISHFAYMGGFRRKHQMLA